MARNTFPPGQRVTQPAFVGRERECAELIDGLRAAQGGAGRVFLIAGEPGIGKTRLLDEVARHGLAAGVSVAWGRGWEGGGAPVYWPWIQIFRTLLPGGVTPQLVAQLGSGAGYLAQLVPELGTHLGAPLDVPVGATLDSAQARFPLFDATARLLRGLAARRAQVLLFDDLHTADDATLLLLKFVAAEVQGAPLLIVGAYREVEGHAHPQRAQILQGIARCGHRIPLVGWPAGDVARYIERIVGTPPSPELGAAVHRVTEGNPLFVDELVRRLVADHPSALPEDLPAAARRVPLGVREAMRERLQPLSATCHRVARIAAVIGRDFDLGRLQAAAEETADALLDALGELRAAGVVVSQPGSLARYSFSHALMRDALYEELAPAERAAMHRRIGAALERLSGGAPEAQLAELAHHFLLGAPGGEVGRAVDYALCAGERAVALLAYEEAVTYYERALEALALEAPRDDRRHGALLLALGQAQARAAAHAPAREAFRQAVELARRCGNTEQLARAVLGFADLGFGVPNNAPNPEVVALLEEALQQLDPGDSVARAQLLARLAMELSVTEVIQHSIALSDDAVAMARRLDAPTALASALRALHFVLWHADWVADRLAIASELVALAERAGDRELALQGRTQRLLDLMRAGDIRALDLEIEHHGQLADELRQPRYLWMAANMQAMRALWRGDFARAEASAKEAMALGERSGEAWTRINSWVQLFVVRREQGRLAEQRAMAEMLAQTITTSPVPRTFLALLYTELGQLDEAQSLFVQLAAEGFANLRRERRIGVLPYLAEVCAALGDARRAAALYDLIAPHAQGTLPYGPSVCFGAATHYLALLAATMGQREEAARHFAAALALHERMEAEPWLARTRYEHARFLAAHGGNRNVVRTHLADVATTARALGMESLLAKALALQTATALPEDPAVAARRAVGGGGLPAPTDDAAPRDVPVAPEGRRGQVFQFPGPHAAPVTGAAGEREPPPPRPDRVGVFRREGEFWNVGSAGTVVRLKDSKGLRYIARLLSAPGLDWHVTDLVGTPPPVGGSGVDLDGLRQDGLEAIDTAAPREGILDARAKATYRRRLEQLRDDLDEATRFNDIDRAARARAELDFLSRELARAVGLGGRDRPAASHAERTRLNVTRTIKDAINRIRRGHPDLGQYFATTIKTGIFCSFTPDPRHPIAWQLD